MRHLKLIGALDMRKTICLWFFSIWILGADLAD
jgi:hypothetical protein